MRVEFDDSRQRVDGELEHGDGETQSGEPGPAGLPRAEQRPDAFADLAEIAAADVLELLLDRRLDGDEEVLDPRVENRLDPLRGEVAPVRDARDLDAAVSRDLHHVEDARMHHRFPLAVELEVLEIGETGEDLLEGLEGQVRLIHGATAAEAADEVAAGRGFDLNRSMQASAWAISRTRS